MAVLPVLELLRKREGPRWFEVLSSMRRGLGLVALALFGQPIVLAEWSKQGFNVCVELGCEAHCA
jgi:hypothetical protein